MSAHMGTVSETYTSFGEQLAMNKGESYLSEGVVFGLLVVLGVLTRLACEAMPNVAPTAAIALFAGFYFRRAWLALAAPLVVMGVSDCFIGGYETVTMLCVYGGLAFPVLLRGWLKRRVKLAGGDARAVMSSSLQIGLCAVIGSLVFFTVSNFGCWLAWGEPTLASLGRTYAQAIPFYRGYTLPGDLLFCGVLFGSYAVVANLAARPVQGAERSLAE